MTLVSIDTPGHGSQSDGPKPVECIDLAGFVALILENLSYI